VVAAIDADLPVASPLTTNSTRRLRWRPSALSFEAAGCVLPAEFCGRFQSSIVDFGVGRGIRTASQQLITSFNTFAPGIGVFQNHRVAWLRYCEKGFGADNHAEGLHIGDGFYFAIAALKRQFTSNLLQERNELFRRRHRRN